MRVLIVEDEPMLALELENELMGVGCEVAGIATSVEQGIRKVQELVIDVAVVDLNLNGKSSVPVASALRARQIPFVFVSGYRPEALPLGYEDVELLAKPLDTDKLIRGLGKVAHW